MATISKTSTPSESESLLEAPDPLPHRDDRRSHDRYDVEWAVDCVAEDTFLYASIANISAMGIFVKTTDPVRWARGSSCRSSRRASLRSSSKAMWPGSIGSEPMGTIRTPGWGCAS